MVERVRNVIKHDTKKTKRPLSISDEDTTPKRRKGSGILKRYPIIQSELEDEATLSQHKAAITTELSKNKPRDTVLLPLMKSTFGERRMFILNEATSVRNILSVYPSLHRPAIVSIMICMHAWWCPCILVH
ncbi:MAG: hypothetical protein A6F71_07510 [Cycloclasticus sp. symbiont of Poecilosclerida sp. M]|nr:MAG: hypothetical protein A6F71_07510 [Cycloclasticus sp. symbiont of Poecilosclerida sp. M]